MARKKRTAKDVLADLEAAGGMLSSVEPGKAPSIHIKHDHARAFDPALEALADALGRPSVSLPKHLWPTPSAPAKAPVDWLTPGLDKIGIHLDDIQRIYNHAATVPPNTFGTSYMDVLDPPPGFASAVEVMFHPAFISYCVAEGLFYIVAPPTITRYTLPAVDVDYEPPLETLADSSDGTDFYLKPDWYETLEALVERGTTVLLIGPAGCGKTQAVEHIFKERKQRLEIVSCTPRTTANDLEGATDLVIQDGQQVTLFTPASPAIASEKGYGLLLDEADAAPSEAMYSMYRLLDHKPMHIVRKGYEGEVPLHADFRVLGTQNTEGRGDDKGLYHGRAYQDEAFLDRWGAVIRVDYPTLEQEVLILRRRTSIKGSDAENIVKAAQALRNSLHADEIMFTCTMRRTLAVAKNIASGFDVKTSWELAAINRATTEDRTKINEILHRIYGSGLANKRKRKTKKG